MIDMTIITIVIVTIIITTVVIIIVVVKLLNMFENMLKATSTLFFFYVFLNVFSWSPLSYSHWYNKHKVAGRSIWASKACVAPGMWSQDRLRLWSEQIGDSWYTASPLGQGHISMYIISYNFMTSSTVHRVWGDGWLSFKITPKLLLMICVSLWCFGCNGP